MRLTTDTDLATQFGITTEKLHELRRQHSWPHVRLGRFDFRFTDQQVEQIVAEMSVVPSKNGGGVATAPPAGLTKRSASRRRAG